MTILLYKHNEDEEVEKNMMYKDLKTIPDKKLRCVLGKKEKHEETINGKSPKVKPNRKRKGRM